MISGSSIDTLEVPEVEVHLVDLLRLPVELKRQRPQFSGSDHRDERARVDQERLVGGADARPDRVPADEMHEDVGVKQVERGKVRHYEILSRAS
jgi:hypothetical protein